MNQFLKITFCVLNILLNQMILSETIESKNFELYLEKCLMAKVLPQTISNGAILINSADSNNVVIVLYERKLKVYADPKLEELQEIQEILYSIDRKDAVQSYSDSNDPIFHTPEVNIEKIYYYNARDCFINAEESISMQVCLIESPCTVLKAKEIEIESFLIDAETVELQSHNKCSLLSSIKFILKDKADLELRSFITGFADFNDNIVVLLCSSVSKIELKCSPGSFYLHENAIFFN